MNQTTRANGAWAAIILAAGRGTRMATTRPKLLHPVGGVPMINRVLNAVADAGITDTTIVRDPSPTLPSTLGLIYPYIIQPTPSGTGGAIRAFLEATTPGSDTLLVLNADLPLITAESLLALQRVHESEPDAVLTFLTFDALADSDAGRILRSADAAIQESSRSRTLATSMLHAKATLASTPLTSPGPARPSPASLSTTTANTTSRISWRWQWRTDIQFRQSPWAVPMRQSA